MSSTKGVDQWNSYGFEGHEFNQPPANDKKTRRRMLYRSISQDRLGAQARPFNYFSQILENKEIGKFTAALANCTQALRDNLQEFMEIWEDFDPLWSPDRYIRAKEFADTNPTWVEFEETLVEYQENASKLNALSNYYDFGAIRITAGKN